MDIITDVFDWNLRRDLLVNPIDVDLEYDMLAEELQELIMAETKVDVADALGDIIWVALGSLAKLTKSSQDVEDIMLAISGANWTKGKNTKSGKITKPYDFVGPEHMIAKILDKPKGLLDE